MIAAELDTVDKLDAAEPPYLRVLDVLEKFPGPGHPNVATAHTGREF